MSVHKARLLLWQVEFVKLAVTLIIACTDALQQAGRAKRIFMTPNNLRSNVRERFELSVVDGKNVDEVREFVLHFKH